MDNTNADIDTYREGEAREILSQDFPDLRLPEMRTAEINFNYLLSLLSENLPDKFIHDLAVYMRDESSSDNNKNNILSENNGKVTLLQRAIERASTNSVTALIGYGAQVNYSPTQTNSPIEICCFEGNWEILEILLKHPEIKLKGLKNPLLSILVRNIGENPNKKTCSYEKCFKILLSDSRIDVNEEDLTGSTALHYAVRFKNDGATLDLLKKASFIGSKNKFSDLPITDIKPKILEKYFDSCIKTNGKRPGDDNLQIMFDYSCFVPTKARVNAEKSASLNHSEEMTPIEYMTKSNELRYLVKHPLISSYLWLKWHRLGCIFYTNFILYSFFCLSMILYIVFCYGNDVNDDLAIALRTLCLIGGVYVLGREIIQFLMSPINYLRNLENYIEIALIIVTVLVLLADVFTETNRRMLGAIAILLAAAEFSMLVGSLPILTITTHMVMLKTVAMSFLKTLILYSIILVSFALCFHSLFAVSPKIVEENPKIPSSGATAAPAPEEDAFSSFNNPGTAILKTIVMLTGEFDAGSINFDLNASSYFIFSLFLFVSIVLFNLLNGLAVSDTHAIKSEAELTGFIYRANILSRYETVIMGKTSNFWSGIASNIKCIHSLSTNLISLFPKFLPMNTIVLTPNDRNKVYILRPYLERGAGSKERLMDDNDLIELKSPSQPLACCFGMERCSRMDGKIVRYARTVLENCDRAIDEEKVQEEMDKRMERIEKNVASIEGMLREILQRR